MKRRNMGLKYVVAIIIFAAAAIALTLGISSWLITSSTRIDPIELTDVIKDKNLLDIKSSVTYDGKAHKPHEDINSFDSSIYDITYYTNDIPTGSGSMFSGFTNAGLNYKVKYVNKETHIITVVAFIIEKATPTVSSSIMYYSPNINDYNLTVTDINKETLKGTLTKISLATHTSDYTSTNGESKDGHTIDLEYSFTPEDNNYATITETCKVPLYSVAFNGSNYYSRIENALYKSSSGTVKIVFGTNPIIYGFLQNDGTYSTTIKSGVTLFLNYDANATNCDDDAGVHSNGIGVYTSGTTPETPYSDKDEDPNIVTLSEEVTLINNGKLIVGGVLSSAPVGIRNGHTSTNYSILLMQKNSIVSSYGNIDCYGFIWEACSKTCSNKPYTTNTCTNDGCHNNGSKVIMHSGALKVPFIIRDMGDGSAMASFKNAVDQGYDCPAFNQFSLENISSEVTFESNAEVIGIFNIYAPSMSMGVSETTSLLNKTANSLIQIHDGSYFTFKFDSKTDIMKFDFYGDFTINSLIVDAEIKLVVVQIAKFTVDTAKSFLPMSWQFDLSFHAIENTSAYVNCIQRLKLMPGSKLTIDENVVFDLTSTIIYDSYTDVTAFARTDYPQTDKLGNSLKPAFLGVAGTLNVGSIGGNVEAISSNAVMNVTKKTPNPMSVTTHEAIENNHLTSISECRITDWHEVKINLIIKTNGSSMNTPLLYAASNTTYRNFDFDDYDYTYYYWGYVTDFTLSFDTGIANITIANRIIEDVYQESNNTGLIIEIESYFPKDMNFKHHNLVGWYYIYNGQRYEINESTEAITIYEDTTFYAIWETIKYDINIGGYLYSGCDETGSITDDSGNEFVIFDNNKYDINTNRALPNPIHSEKYTFGGWFFDEECINQPVVSIIGLDYVDSGSITLYGLWFPKDTETYTINYVMQYPDGYTQAQINEITSLYSTTSSSIISTRISEYSMPMNCYANNLNTEFTSYFIGWYDVNGILLDNSTLNNTLINNKLVEMLLELDEANKSLSDESKITSITIYCKWGSKTKVTINDYRSSTGLLRTRNTAYIIPGTYEVNNMNENIKSFFTPLTNYDGSDYAFSGYNTSTSATSLNTTTITISGSETTIYLHYKMYVNLIVKAKLALGTDTKWVIITKNVTLQSNVTFTINGSSTTLFAKGANKGDYNNEGNTVLKVLEGTSYSYSTNVGAKGNNSYTINPTVTTTSNTTLGTVGREKTETITLEYVR